MSCVGRSNLLKQLFDMKTFNFIIVPSAARSRIGSNILLHFSHMTGFGREVSRDVWSVFTHIYIYIYKTTNASFLQSCNQTDGMGIFRGEMRPENPLKVTSCCDDYTRIISVIFSPSHRCWSRSAAGDKQGECSAFIPAWIGVKKPSRFLNPSTSE